VFKTLESIISGGVRDKDEELKEDKATFVLQGHGIRVKHFNLYFYEQNKTWYMASVSSDGKIVVWDLANKDQAAVYSTGDRLNCVVVVPDNVEKYETMKKRATGEDESAAEETDFSEAEGAAKQKRKKTKRAKVTVEVEK
jgi:protein MAK11